MLVSNTRPPPEKPADIAVGSTFVKLSLNSILSVHYFVVLLVSVRLIQGPSQQRPTLSHGDAHQTGFHHAWTPAAEQLPEPENVDELMMIIHLWCRQVSALNQSQHSQHLWNTDAWRTQPRTAPPRDPGRKDNKNSDSAESWFLLLNIDSLIFGSQHKGDIKWFVPSFPRQPEFWVFFIQFERRHLSVEANARRNVKQDQTGWTADFDQNHYGTLGLNQREDLITGTARNEKNFSILLRFLQPTLKYANLWEVNSHKQQRNEEQILMTGSSSNRSIRGGWVLILSLV